MLDDDNDSASGEKSAFTGEEDTGELVSARQNLAAALVLGSIAILAMALALGMENTGGSIYSAAGLLPFLVGFSLKPPQSFGAEKHLRNNELISFSYEFQLNLGESLLLILNHKSVFMNFYSTYRCIYLHD